MGQTAIFCNSGHHPHQSNHCWHSHKRNWTTDCVWLHQNVTWQSPPSRSNKQDFLRIKLTSEPSVCWFLCCFLWRVRLIMELSYESVRYDRRPASCKVCWKTEINIAKSLFVQKSLCTFWSELKWNCLWRKMLTYFSMLSCMSCTCQMTSGIWNSIKSLQKP